MPSKKRKARPLRLVLEASGKQPRELSPTLFGAHGAILAQSGSGKSFLLGRLVEELALSTKARLLIIDPNSDFLRINKTDGKIWSDPKIKPWFFPNDDKVTFETQWAKISTSISIASNRNLEDLAPLRVDWGQLSISEMAAVLNIDQRHEGDLVSCLTITADYSSAKWPADTDPSYDFPFYRDRADDVSGFLRTGDGDEFLKTSPFANAVRSSGGKQIALRFSNYLESIQNYEIWRHNGEKNRDVADLTNDDWRILVIDLQSLSTDEERLTIVTRALETVWSRARKEFQEASRDPDATDHRVPTFVIIDEAHNLAPSEKDTPAVAHVASMLVRIAAEGRKYGLFLLIATQRPRKIDSNILSECENLILMKMKNQTDLAYASEILGYLEPDIAGKAKGLGKGDALLRGNISTTSDVIHCAPRRTVQGGKGLTDYWTES